MPKTEKKTCPTCGSITSPYIFTFDILDAKLLLGMARAVRANWAAQAKDAPFKAANKVHVPSLNDLTLAIRCRTTQCSKLGLIAKHRENDKQVPGTWLITARGWIALRGGAVPRQVEVFRKNIVDRPGAQTTMAAIAKEAEYRYESGEWVEFSDGSFAIVGGEVVEKNYDSERLL